MRIRFDRGSDGAGLAFDQPLRIVRADDVSEVPDALAALDTANAAGHWLAGFASYELGYSLDPKLHALLPGDRRHPLLCFGVYAGPVADRNRAIGEFTLETFQPDWSFARYQEAFETLHDFIGAGDVYQVNLTFPLRARMHGDADGLFAALAARQPVAHAASVEMPGGTRVLSRSPELFFRLDGSGGIVTRPMKGTAPRGESVDEDQALRDGLMQDEKTLAENLMIVDLLRNDLSRLALPGSVAVPRLFDVETYATVHQMVSEVEARLPSSTKLSDILTALFPCGSITGAPKIRAMEIIRMLEDTPREVYCGTIGWVAPDRRAEFNVAIRTLTIENGCAVLNVGGGLVWDSCATSEYQEALWKSRFALFQ